MNRHSNTEQLGVNAVPQLRWICNPAQYIRSNTYVLFHILLYLHHTTSIKVQFSFPLFDNSIYFAMD